MKVQKTIKKETIRVAAGTIILTGVMIGVYLLLGSLVWKTLLASDKVLAFVIGAVIGCFAAVLDFFLLGLSVQNAAEYQAAHPLKEEDIKAAVERNDETEDGTDRVDNERKRPFVDPATAAVIQKKMKRSYMLRRLLMLCFAALGLLPFINNLIAVVLPLLFPKFVVVFVNLKENRKKGGK